MTYNLTEKQKELACALVKEIREQRLSESFIVMFDSERVTHTLISLGQKLTPRQTTDSSLGEFDALTEAKLLLTKIIYRTQQGIQGSTFEVEDRRECTVTASLYKAVYSNFAEDETGSRPISTLAQPHPPEIAMSLDRLRAKYPDPKKLGFLVMRFTAAKPFSNIVEVVKMAGEEHGLTILRADAHDFHGDLWGNVRTYLHGCGFGIAVYERIETNEPNANVGLEVGYLMAMNKPVLLLKDKTLPALQADLAGKLYKNFDPHDPVGTIPEQMTKWLVDNGIIVPKHG
jgi:hypothetical protein